MQFYFATLYALRVLRKYGLSDDSLHYVFRAVAVAKLMYASSAWWGFSNANDRSLLSFAAVFALVSVLQIQLTSTTFTSLRMRNLTLASHIEVKVK